MLTKTTHEVVKMEGRSVSVQKTVRVEETKQEFADSQT
jgi:hypothetical protein